MTWHFRAGESQADSVLEGHEADGVVTLTLARPDRLNALDNRLLEDLAEALAACRRSPDVRAVVLNGRGRAFCAGADLQTERVPTDELARLRSRFHPVVLELAALDKPVIAAVNGVVAGAGLTLACAADIRIASKEAKFVPAYARLGLIPDAGASFFIPRLIGWGRAFEWFALSREISADEALDWGLVSQVLPADELMDRANAIARQLAEMPGVAAGLTRRLLMLSSTSTLAQQLENEAALQGLALAAPARAEALLATPFRRHRGDGDHSYRGDR